MPRSRDMQVFVDQFSLAAFGRTNSQSIKTDTCVFCGKPVIAFKDSLSEKEFKISGLCQKCQDATFGA